MKKMLFKKSTLITFLVIIMMFGCKTPKDMVIQKQKFEQINIEPIPQVEEVKAELVLWRNQIRDISPDKGVLFYNDSEITLEKTLSDPHTFVKDGIVNVIDTINNILKSVPRLTSGILVKTEFDFRGEIRVMFISFSENERTYTFSFVRTTEGRFMLNGTATLIFKSKEYPVTAAVKENCFLAFYLNKQKVIIQIKEQAKGQKY